MTINITAPWHRASFETLLNERLPQLLAEHVPLLDYEWETVDDYTCRLKLTLASPKGEVRIDYSGLPQPDQDGVFRVKDQQIVVLPYAEHDDIEQAEIFCVGEQLYAHIQQRLGKAPADLSWDSALLRAWFPLDQWINEFFEGYAHHSGSGAEVGWADFVQLLDQTNWLARQTHLRRLYIKNRRHLFTQGHFGRTCPFETPEGPNIGRILVIAVGAEIRNGKLRIVDENPAATLGLGASMIPLLEHDAPERLLMGANMLRQWIVPPTPEPALVQSGNEVDAPGFWCGRNLLTAFISWGEDTFEDGIVLSESCARRLSWTYPVEPGDKLSNRHGTKGVVSRILPDDEMPHLADGTPVELVFNFISLHRRAYFGQVHEAVLSRVARVQGQPMVIPPFQAPTEQQIRAWLTQAGVPTDGVERLTDGRTGPELAQASTVGWVYWGKLYHEARSKLQVAAGHADGRAQRLNDDGYMMLREAGALEIIREQLTTSTTAHAESATLVDRLAQGKVEIDGPPTPHLSALMKRLTVMGVHAELREHDLAFHLTEPEGATLTLAYPVAHPWLSGHLLTRVGAMPELPAYQALVEANTRAERVQSSRAPESLRQQAQAQLELRVREYCAALHPSVQFETRIQFSGRGVLAPATNLHLNQVGIAEELAWSLFGPFVARELPAEEVQARSERAARVLDATMARSWAIIHRSPASTPQTFLAFHPVRNANHVIRIHPLACRLLQADFDGDQAAIFLPLSEAAQREAGAQLSVAAHLARTPDLLRDLLPNNDALWGLAHLSLTDTGRQEIAALIGSQGVPNNVLPAGEIVTRAWLEEALQQILQYAGAESTLEILEQLLRLGFASARASGASISPFVGSRFALPPAPDGDESEAWKRYQAEASEWLAASTSYQDLDLGPQLLAVKSGAWGEIQDLLTMLSGQGLVRDSQGRQLAIRHGYRAGLSAAELFALAIGARERLALVLQDMLQLHQEVRQRNRSRSFYVLARAMRAEQPALVFAHAASIGEVDPLTDLDSRLFVGLL